MSQSDCDSDGFESAEDDDFKSENAPAKSDGVTKSSKNSHNQANASSAKSTTPKESETFNKLKALDINEDENNDADDWGWGDEEDNDNFNFDSKPKVSETSKIESEPPKHRDNQNSTVQSMENPKQSSSQDSIRAPSQPETPSAWSPWSGMVSLLSTASTGVASFTSHVSSVIESNIGIPDAEKFAQQQYHEKSETIDQNDDASDTKSTESKQPSEETMLNLGSFVSNVTSISNRVIAGGLDTLEGIGKKTMTILQENDAGLISKRKLLGLDIQKPVLSQVLREAKEKSEESEKTMKLTQKKLYKKQLHFETLFDDYHGLVHLEALEMLSKQASMKLQSLLMPLSGIALNELQQTLNSVNELCELNELDQEDSPTQMYDVTELEEKFKAATEDFDIPIDFTDILE